MMEPVGVLDGVRSHEDACAKKAEREPCCWSVLSQLPLDVHWRLGVVNEDVQAVF
jgi:hypothetical protein